MFYDMKTLKLIKHVYDMQTYKTCFMPTKLIKYVLCQQNY